MNIICFAISCMAIICICILSYFEYKGKIDFSSKLGFFATYLINYILILLPYYFNDKCVIEINFKCPFIQGMIDNKLEIGVLLSIIGCNYLTKWVFKNLCKIEDFNAFNKKHQNIMSGLILSLTVIALTFGDYELFFSLAFFIIGNRVEYSIYKDKSDRHSLKDIKLILGTTFLTFITLGLFYVTEKYLSPYEQYFLIPWIVTIILLLVVICVILIAKKKRLKNAD